MEEVAARLAVITARIRRLRASIYPSDWTADPWYLVQKELQALLEEMRAPGGLKD